MQVSLYEDLETPLGVKFFLHNMSGSFFVKDLWDDMNVYDANVSKWVS